MPLTCAIAGCSNNYQRTKGNKISFHLFPKNESARQEWIKLCGRDHPFNAKTWRVCSLHFDANDFERDLQAELLNYTPKAKKLKLGALPIIVNKQKEDNNFISVPTSTSELQEPMEVKTLDISDWQRESIINLKAGSSVAAWLSETVLRGRGPGASGFESHRRGRIFSKEGNSAGPWMCVYV
jgi:hypothetical protein